MTQVNLANFTGNYAQTEPSGVASSTTATFNSKTTKGNAIVALAMNGDSTPVSFTTVTDSRSNKYTKIPLSFSTITASGWQCAMYVAFNIAGDPTTPDVVTFNFSGTLQYAGLYAFEVAGVTAVGGASVGWVQDAVAGTVTAPEFYMPAPGIIVAATLNTGGASGPGAGYTQITITSGNLDILEYKIVTAPGQQAPSAVLSGENTYILSAVGLYTPLVT
jgi:hypothetical protein